MSEDRIGLLRRLRGLTWDKEEWFVPLAASLEGLTAAEAAWRPPGGGNTIWQTVNHINYYDERLLCRLTERPFGPVLPDNDATFGEPGNPDDGTGWQEAVQRTRRVAAGLRTALDARSDADLEQPLSGSSLGEYLTAWIMHDAYHTGQIVLMRKQQGSWPANRG